MKLRIVEDYDELSLAAARIVAGCLRAKPTSVLGLATGGTPAGMYAELIRMHREEGLDFGAATTFNLDEYYPVGPMSPRSYRAYMQEHLFAHVNLPEARAHIPDGTAADVATECVGYERKIRRAGGIDLQVLGIGRNGHIGFNEPGTDFDSETHLIDLSEETRRANSRFFEAEAGVPTQAISMGIKSIMRARAILLLASGPDKAQAVGSALEGEVATRVPASVLQLHPDVCVVVDRAAARLVDRAS